MFRNGPKYNPNMLISALYFWEHSTNTFHLHYEMITPTLYDVATITDLRPTRDTFNPTLKHKIKPNFLFTRHGFSNYIEDQHEDTEEVSDYEHILCLLACLTSSNARIISTPFKKIKK